MKMNLSHHENKPEKQIYLNRELLKQVRESVSDIQGLINFLGIRIAKTTSRHFVCYSPFREERTPSLFIDFNNHQWFDQGDFTKGGGGMFELVCHVQGLYTSGGLDVYQAGRVLLQNNLAFLSSSTSRSTIPTKTNYDTNKQSEIKKTSKENKPIPKKLSLTPYLDFSHSYLKERNFNNKENLKGLGIGYLPPSSNSQLFRGRIITQVRDIQQLSDGNFKSVLKGHIGKAIHKEQEQYGKFITMTGFEKSAELLNIDNVFTDETIQEQVKNNGLLIVEGSFDLLRFYDAGIKNIIATFGANLSKEQAEKIILLSQNIEIPKIKFMYDRDQAGFKASKAGENLLKKLNLKIPVESFDWSLKIKSREILNEINDPADFSVEQLQFLKKNGKL